MAGNVPSTGETNVRRIVQSIRELYEGRSNCVGTVTLAANVTTTTVTAQNCGQGSTVILFPTTAHAATELGNGTIYVSAVNNATFVLTHANNAQTDRTFGWAAWG